MIDREDVVKCFHELFEPQASHRVLRLLGEAKMGKSHLLTKVLPALAQQHASCAVLDLRSSQQTIIEHLHNLCSLLGRDHFPTFDQAYMAWQNQPHIQASGVRAIFSIISMRNRTQDDDTERVIPQLTRCFVEDLSQLDDRPVLLIFDQVDDAPPRTRAWLIDTLLVQLQSMDHLRTVVGGRNMPSPSGSYASLCHSFELEPVEEENAYIKYCREIGAELMEQSIRDFAKASFYIPGLFAETITIFVPKG